jgi:signal transduction histidine kinase
MPKRESIDDVHPKMVNRGSKEDRRKFLAAGEAPLRRMLFSLFCLSLTIIPPAFTSESTQPRNALILLSSEYGLPAYDAILHEIRKGLKSGVSGPLNLYAEYMDSARFPAVHEEQAAIDFYNQKYGEIKIDLLIAIGPNLVTILQQFDEQLFFESPTVIIDLVKPGVDLPAAFRKPNMTGVFPNADIHNTIAVALSLHPSTEHIFVISGASVLDMSLDAQARAVCRGYENTIRVHYLSGMSMAAILRTVGALPDHSVVLFTTMQMDAAGVPYYTREATGLVAARSTAPVYALFDTNADVGGVGGHVVSFKKVGIKAAEIALRILKGESPGEIPPIRDRLHEYTFDERQRSRWGIPERRLPPGSILLHREVSFLEAYRWHVIGIALFISLQSALIAFLVVMSRRQKTLSAKLVDAERRYRELLRIERSTRLGEMAGSLGHELNQPLAAILSSAQAALRFLKSGKLNQDLLREILQQIVTDDKRAAAIITGLRTLLKRGQTEKEPVLINDIIAEVTTLFHGEAIARQIRIERDFADVLPAVMGNKTHLQQVMLNLIMNAADATAQCAPDDRRLVLRTRLNGSSVEVSVRDFGPGIDPARMDHLFEPFFTTKSTGMGMGLKVCRAIIEDHEGRIGLENSPDRGATFVIELPAMKNG